MINPLKNPVLDSSMELALTLRALLFRGDRYTCPCCGWNLREFTRGGASIRTRPEGYCPRCNSKARHRRWWLFLQEQTNLFTAPLRLLYLSPNYCFSRRFSKLRNIDYIGLGYSDHRNIRVKSFPSAIPLAKMSVDAIICMHVLEHIPEDRAAIGELYRVLRPGGWAGFSVPIRLDQPTYEDPSIVSPEAREKAFGEPVHVRYYGSDFPSRLLEAGFDVRMFPAGDVISDNTNKFGLKADENIFFCQKK